MVFHSLPMQTGGVKKHLRRYAPATLFLVINILAPIPSCAGQKEDSPNQQTRVLPDAPARAAPPATPVSSASGYTFPTGRQQFHNYLASAFGPQAFVAAAVGASLDQAKPAPPEWDRGGLGFGERYGFRYGVVLITTTTKYSLGAVTREDVSYHKCDCSGFFPRAFHSVSSTVTARTRSGRTVLSFPALAAPYAGAFAAVNAWYPARYGPQDTFRTGSMSFAFSAGANMVREFLLPRR
jgi:hypothetical protein